MYIFVVKTISYKMATINFRGKTNPLTDLEIYYGFTNNISNIISIFYREERIPFENTINKTYGVNFINNITSIDDIYNISFMRLIDMFQRKKFIVCDEKVCYTKDGYTHTPLECTISSFFKSIGKIVFKELKRDNDRRIDDIVYDEPYEKMEEEDVDNDNNVNEPIDEDIDTNTRIKDSILVWRIIETMKDPCKTILGETLTKELSGKNDSDIAMELGYKGADIVKSNRTKCKQKFQTTFIKERDKF